MLKRFELKEVKDKKGLSVIEKIKEIEGELIVAPDQLIYFPPPEEELRIMLTLNWKKTLLYLSNISFGASGPMVFSYHEDLWEFENIHFYSVPKGLRKDISVEEITEYLYVNPEIDLSNWSEDIQFDSEEELIEEFIYLLKGFSDVEKFEKLEAQKYKEE